MKHELRIYGWIALGLAASGNALAQDAAPDTDAIVKAVMADQYNDGYDAAHGCWKYTVTDEQEGDTLYCMRPGKAQIVDTPAGKTLYLSASSAADIMGDKNYRYAPTQSGLMGAFKIKLGGPRGWVYTAISKDLDFGTNGQCGCKDAKFVKLSNDGDYGWMFTSGGSWQGVTVSNYSIIAARKGAFSNISHIPEVRENDQDVHYDASVQASTTQQKGLFPLHVIKTKSGAKVDDIVVKFDDKKAEYALPAGR